MSEREAVRALADKLAASRAPVLFGLYGLSMENQRRCARLARALSCCVSVERPAWAGAGLFAEGGEAPEGEPVTDNRAGACEVLLEEAGGLSARFTNGAPHPDAIFSLDALLRAKAVDCALLVGHCDTLPDCLGAEGGVPLLVLGGAAELAPRAALFVPAASFGAGEGGTALRTDGVPVCVPPGAESPLFLLSALLDALITEVAAC